MNRFKQEQWDREREAIMNQVVTEPSEQEDVAKYFQRGADAIRAGNYIEAISLAQTAEKLSQGMFRTYPKPLKKPFQR